MAFEKGISGNYEGRPKGALNKTSIILREALSNFLLNNFDSILMDIESLSPKDRVKIYFDLLHYALPKLQPIEIESEFDRLSDDQLDLIIQELKNGH